MGANDCNNHHLIEVDPIFSYAKFEDLLPELEGYRVRIIYDSTTVKDLIVLQYIIPYFSKIKDTYIVLYSEALYYKFKKNVCELIKKLPELKKSFEKLKVIKIGIKEECAFGKLAGFVRQGNPENEFNGLLKCLEKIDADDVLILNGSFVYYLTAIGKTAFKRLIDMYSILPEGLTLFGFRHHCVSNSPEIDLIGDLYDVVIYIHKDEQAFDDRTYHFKVDCPFDQCSK